MNDTHSTACFLEFVLATRIFYLPKTHWELCAQPGSVLSRSLLFFYIPRAKLETMIHLFSQTKFFMTSSSKGARINLTEQKYPSLKVVAS